MRRLALRSALRQKLDEKTLFAVRLESFEKPRTARLARALKGITGGRRALLLTAGYDENLFLSGRNIPGLTMKQFKDVTACEILLNPVVLVEEGAVVAGAGPETQAGEDARGVEERARGAQARRRKAAGRPSARPRKASGRTAAAGRRKRPTAGGPGRAAARKRET